MIFSFLLFSFLSLPAPGGFPPPDDIFGGCPGFFFFLGVLRDQSFCLRVGKRLCYVGFTEAWRLRLMVEFAVGCLYQVRGSN